MDDDQQFCLRWNNHQSTLISVFDTLLENGTLVDCTLAAEGKFLKAHKVVLSACSPYFAALMSQQYDKHPIFILKDVKYQELRAMMDYMYRGEVNISQDQLAALLKAAESLQIKGLSDNRGTGAAPKSESAKPSNLNPLSNKPGLSIEHKRPAVKSVIAGSTIESDASMTREGSTSPSSRKRKKVRRRTVDQSAVGNMHMAADNHDQMSNSSSQSQSNNQQQSNSTHSAAALPQITSATSTAIALNAASAIKKTEQHAEKDLDTEQHDDDDDEDDEDEHQAMEPPMQRQKHGITEELLLEPKSEYDNDETVEDLTMDDEELLEDLDQAGPSHGGEGSSQGYAQWQERSQDELFGAQESGGQHRDAQDGEDGTEDIYVENTDPMDDELIICEESSGSLKPNSTVQPAFTWSNDHLLIVNDSELVLCSSDETSDNATKTPQIRYEIQHVLPTTANTTVSSGSAYTTTPILLQHHPANGNTVVTPTATIIKKQPSAAQQLSSNTKDPLEDDLKAAVDAAAATPMSVGDQKRFVCPRCGKDYSQSKNMRRHYRLECGQEPKYPCPYCQLRFKRNNQLKNHIISRHCLAVGSGAEESDISTTGATTSTSVAFASFQTKH